MGLSDLFVAPANLPKGVYGDIQLIFLLLVYGFILSKSSALISDGSELLLLIPAIAGMVGSIVLPVLGAVPDGAIVLFSGMGPDAQNQIGVGVGALAGSTIMLLTIPWALCIFKGRVDIVAGAANYKAKTRLSEANKWSISNCGITPRPSIAFNAKIMIATAVSYVFIQGSAFFSKCDLVNHPEECKSSGEHWWALISLLTCIGFFIGYMVYNVKTADSEDKEDLIAEVKKQAVESHIMSLSAAFEADLNLGPEGAHLLSSDDQSKRFDDALKTFFRRYDINGDGVIDVRELRFLLEDIHENMSEDRFQQFLKELDTDGSGNISFAEFSVAIRSFIKKKHDLHTEAELSVQSGPSGEAGVDLAVASAVEHEEEEEEEEEEEVPEDLASLSPSKQKMRILLRAGWMMGLGTIVVLLFSDPMVDVLNELGVRFSINPFYVAFVLAPVASNASELIASINYSMKKTKKTITISLAALEGAACMNNTFCLGIFLALIFFKNLVWEFSAETISILLVEVALFFVAQIKTHRLYHAAIILSLYPASLFTVWLLERLGLN